MIVVYMFATTLFLLDIPHKDIDHEAFVMAKLALNGFTRILAAELGQNSNVKVNSLDPGWVKTDMGGADAARDPSEPAREIADLVSISADGPSGGFFRGGEQREW